MTHNTPHPAGSPLSKKGDTNEWGEHIDTKTPIGQRTDAERFEHALDMGLKAAEVLERDENLGLISPRKRPRYRLLAALAAGSIVLTGVGAIAVATHYARPTPSEQSNSHEESFGNSNGQSVPLTDQERSDKTGNKQETQNQEEAKKPDVIAEANDDGSYHAHVDLSYTDGKAGTTTVQIPAKAARAIKPWVMRVHTTIDHTKKYVPSCDMTLTFETSYGDEWTEQYYDRCRTDSNTLDYTVPLFPNLSTDSDKVGHAPSVLTVSGGNAQLDLDFLLISAAAVAWDTSEPLKGSDSTIVAFSGSLKDLKLHHGGNDIDLFLYAPGNTSITRLNDPYTSSSKPAIKRELIEELGYDESDASGYLFVKIKSRSSQPSWWQLN